MNYLYQYYIPHPITTNSDLYEVLYKLNTVYSQEIAEYLITHHLHLFNASDIRYNKEMMPISVPAYMALQRDDFLTNISESVLPYVILKGNCPYEQEFIANVLNKSHILWDHDIKSLSFYLAVLQHYGDDNDIKVAVIEKMKKIESTVVTELLLTYDNPEDVFTSLMENINANNVDFIANKIKNNNNLLYSINIDHIKNLLNSLRYTSEKNLLKNKMYHFLITIFNYRSELAEDFITKTHDLNVADCELILSACNNPRLILSMQLFKEPIDIKYYGYLILKRWAKQLDQLTQIVKNMEFQWLSVRSDKDKFMIIPIIETAAKYGQNLSILKKTDHPYNKELIKNLRGNKLLGARRLKAINDFIAQNQNTKTMAIDCFIELSEEKALKQGIKKFEYDHAQNADAEDELDEITLLF